MGKLKGHWELVEELVDDVQELEEDGSEATVLAGVIQVTPVVEPVPVTGPLLLQESPEPGDSSVVRVQTELGQAGDLTGEVPALLQAEHHTGALDVHQVGHGPGQLHDGLQQEEPLGLLHQLVEGLLGGITALGHRAGVTRLHQLLETRSQSPGLCK